MTVEPQQFTQYYVLPDDPLRALNVLREAAGLEPLSSGYPSEPADAGGGGT